MYRGNWRAVSAAVVVITEIGRIVWVVYRGCEELGVYVRVGMLDTVLKVRQCNNALRVCNFFSSKHLLFFKLFTSGNNFLRTYRQKIKKFSIKCTI